MLTTLKYKTKDQNIFFCSDTHFNHERPWIVDARGFKTVQEHDAVLIKKWNETVKDTDLVFFLGDFCFEANSEIAANYYNMLNGKILTLWGNHFSGVRQLYKRTLKEQFGDDSIEIYPLIWNNKVTFLGDYVKLVIDNQMIVLSHFAFRIWDSMHHDSWCLSGHSHGNDKGRLPEIPNEKAFDVGVDVFGRPISFAEVKEIMDKKKVVLHDHHNTQTNNGF